MGCRKAVPQGELLRLASLEGEVRPDPARRMTGRGAYLHPRQECAARAVKREAFRKAFRGPVRLGTETLEWIDEWRRSASSR